MEYTKIQDAHPDSSAPTHLVVSREEAPAVSLTTGRFGSAQPAENRANRFGISFWSGPYLISSRNTCICEYIMTRFLGSVFFLLQNNEKHKFGHHVTNSA